ncbi:MAG TPA: ribosomal-processing cysteine protease Prp [Candidatus Cottocaccamicrobium excrementipullorum]|nr:ribosomal-processing cysteine protease Prp [Candidatus Cottocaccamicrobium excrementipullorum]
MIKATVFQDSEGQICGVELRGHAGYGEYGQDIICSAVSVLAINFANSVETFTEDGFTGEVDQEKGDFSFHFTDHISSQSRLLMDSMVLGLKTIAESYGNEYISIQYREV